LAALHRGADLRRSARAHWFARMIPRIDVSRRYFPSCASSASSSVAALASAPMPSRHRPAGAACVKSDADRPAGASLEVSLASLRRSLVAPYRPEQPAPDHPASALFPTSAPTPGGRLARAVFSASRLALLFNCVRCQTPPRGSFVADFFRPTYRIRAGCYRDLAGTVKVPATPMGFT